MRVESPHRFTKAASVLALTGAAFLGGVTEAHSQIPSSPVRQCEPIPGLNGHTEKEGEVVSREGEAFLVISPQSWKNGCTVTLVSLAGEVGGIDPGETIRR